MAASLCRGLKTLGLPFALNPKRIDDARTVAVLSDLDALEEAVAWKRGGENRRLLAGPNLVVLPSDARPVMTAPEIDLHLVPSGWVKDVYEQDTPELIGRIAVWPAGVDETRWSPARHNRAGGRRAAVYRKALPGQRNADDSVVAAARKALEDAGFSVRTLEYGRFGPGHYRQVLRSIDVLVFFSPSESQCIALAEAWSVNVPTLVWSCGLLRYRGQVYRTSSAPYLSSKTGLFFDSAPELNRMLTQWDDLRSAFAPREWLLQHMTDRLAAQAFSELANLDLG